jgi:two-component system nitrate/nitrite response regulator NarL
MLTVPLEAPVMDVVVAIRNDLLRYGVERMLQVVGGIGRVECRSELPASTDVPTDPDPGPDSRPGADRAHGVVIVVLSEIDDTARLTLRRIGQRDTKILLLLAEEEFAELKHLPSAMVAGFVTINELNASTLRDALVRMNSGEMPMSPRLTRNLMAMVQDRAPEATTVRPRMTPREKEVIVLLVEGLSNKQIARRLRVSEHGAKRLVANILAKMDCANRTLAVVKALREGFYEEYSRTAPE